MGDLHFWVRVGFGLLCCGLLTAILIVGVRSIIGSPVIRSSNSRRDELDRYMKEG